MIKSELKEYIKNNLIKKDGSLNQAAFRWGKFDNIKDDLYSFESRGLTDNENIYLFYFDKDPGVCLNPKCQNKTSFLRFKIGYSNYCSNKCAQSDKSIQEKKEKTTFIHHGVKNPGESKELKEKIKQTNLKKYGVESHNSVDIIKEKKKQTYLKKYGVDNPLKSIKIRKKVFKTKEEKYGNGNYFAFGSEEYNLYIKEKYGVENVSQIKEIKNRKKQKAYSNVFIKLKKDEKFIILDEFDEYNGVLKKYNWECQKCGNIFYSSKVNRRCPYCQPYFGPISKAEKEIFDLVGAFDSDIRGNVRDIIPPLELDIYSPKYNLAIEFNGLYWHSEMNGKDRNYHLNKTLECEKQGIRLIHIFENEWFENKVLIKNKIENIFGIQKNKIGARETTIKEIESKLKNGFLIRNHIQGTDKSSVKLGAFYKDELVGVMTFSKPRISLGSKSKKGSWELSRFATSRTVVGLASKMLKHFEKNYHWDEIYSYADRRWSQGDVYYKSGFSYLHSTKPNYWYIVNGQLKHRFGFRKQILKDKIDIYDENLTEWQNMQLNGYDRIWDCGHLKFAKYQ